MANELTKQSAILEHLEENIGDYPNNENKADKFIRAYATRTYWKETGTTGLTFVSDTQLYPGEFSKWSDEDLQFVINNLDVFGKNHPDGDKSVKYRQHLLRFSKSRHKSTLEKAISTVTPFSNAAAATVGNVKKVGLLPAIEHQVEINKPGSPKLLEALLAILASKGGTAILDQSDETIIGKYFRLNEDAILRLVSLEPYRFRNFDLLITEKMNEFLDSDPLIKHVLVGGPGPLTKSSYFWPAGDEEEIVKDVFIAAGVEKSLVDNNEVKYKFPFSDKLKDRENTVRLDANKGFSKFEAGKLRADNIFSSESVLTDVFLDWGRFIMNLLKVAERRSDGKYDFNKTVVDELFSRQADIFLKNGFRIKVPTSDNLFSFEGSIQTREYVAKKLLDVFRYTAWKVYAKELKGKTKDQVNPDAALAAAKKAFEAGEQAAKNSEAAVGGEPPDGEVLSQKEIEARQRFMKQCALMTRLPTLAREHLGTLKGKKIHKKNVYGKRFYMVKDGDDDQSGIMTKLLLPKGKSIQEFLDITPATHAHLTPKLRFFKVMDGRNGPEEVEFKFRNFTSRDRVNNLSSEGVFDKGGDYGIKEFSFSFEGTTPATAKNDIKANLSLFFQSFQDFIDKGFVDMLLLPGKNTQEPQETKFAYSARYYRIRVDVGWTIDSLNVESLKSSLGKERFRQLKNALLKTNKSFYLNMVDHTLDFKDDGSVQIDVEYRAYIETSTKGTKLDALASPDILKTRDKIRKDYLEILSRKKCNTKELAMIKAQLDQISTLLAKQSFQSIINRLIENGCMYVKKLRETSDDQFQRQGFFTERVKFADEKVEPSTKKTQAQKSKKDKTLTYSENSYNEDLSNDKDYLFVNYFYLGDLLYVITDSMYDEKGQYKSGYERFKFILGSFQYQDVFPPSATRVINLAQIPISTELFFEWFTENVLKPERTNYPIMYFIRDLCKHLVGDILSETCFRKSIDKSLHFQTTNFMGIGDPVGSLKGSIKDIGKNYNSKDSIFPLSQDSEKKLSVSDFTNYIMVYVTAPVLQVKDSDDKYKRGNKSNDQDIGIYHYQIGKPHGLLKKLKFSKTDMQYIREARFFRSGYDGLLQLAAVYKVSLDMIGNTLYYPGMEIFVNPLGFMGATNSNYNPAIRNSVANKLGFGGYHLVTSVKSTIAPGRFTTQVEAMFNYSGDGDPSSTVYGSADAAKSNKKITDKSDAFKNTGGYCANVYNQVINRALQVADGGKYVPLDSNSADPITDKNATEAQVDRAVEQIETDYGVRGSQSDQITLEDLDLGNGVYQESNTGRAYVLDDKAGKIYLED